MNSKFDINTDLIQSIEKLIHSNLVLAAKKFADVYQLDENEIIKKCIPDITIKDDMNNHNDKMTIINEVNSISQIEKMKVTDIKYYLQHYDLKISGKKQVLVERLWEYIKDNKTLVEVPNKKKCYHIVDMSETDEAFEIGEYLDIYLDKQRPIANVVNKSIGVKYYLDAETNYVSELCKEDKQLYYVGYLAEDGKTVDFQHEMDLDIDT